VLKCVYRLHINLAFIISVSGTFVGAIDISAKNGSLLFPRVLLDHRGEYNVTVFTSNGNDTATYRLIVQRKFGKFYKKFSITWKNKCVYWLYCKHFFAVDILLCLKYINKTHYTCTQPDTTIYYFIVILLLATSFGLNGPSSGQYLLTPWSRVLLEKLTSLRS
jgi:hypothetical protein